jgi:hypothetical protein
LIGKYAVPSTDTPVKFQRSCGDLTAGFGVLFLAEAGTDTNKVMARTTR